MVELIPDSGYIDIPRHNNFTLNISVWDPIHRQKTIPFRAQVDTGAWALYISHEKVEEYQFQVDPSLHTEAAVSTVRHEPIEILGSVRIPWYPEKGGECLWDTFYVVNHLASDVLIGRRRWNDVMSQLKPSVFARISDITSSGGAYDLVRDRRTGKLDLHNTGAWSWSSQHSGFYRLRYSPDSKHNFQPFGQATTDHLQCKRDMSGIQPI